MHLEGDPRLKENSIEDCEEAELLAEEMVGLAIPAERMGHYGLCWRMFGAEFSAYYDCCLAENYIGFHEGLPEYWALHVHALCRLNGVEARDCQRGINARILQELERRPEYKF